MRNALWLDSLTITEEPRDFEVYGRIRWRCEPANVLDHCIKCGVSAERLYKHGANPKKYADLPHAGHHVYICIWVQRYRCRECGGTFDHPLPEMDDNRKMTNRCVAYVREHGKRRTFADIAREIGVDEKTIRNVCKEGFVEALEDRDYGSPKILGLDELMLVGELRAIFVDVGAKRTLDIIEDRKKWQVARWLSRLDRTNVEIVTMDMTGHYRDVVRGNIPRAAVIIDKFHVIRMADFALKNTRNRVRRNATGAGRRNPWGNVRMLQRSRHTLTVMEKLIVDGLCKNNPLVGMAYQAKESFRDIWKAGSRDNAERMFNEWCKSLPDEMDRDFGHIARSIDRHWREEVFAYFDYPATNAYVENRNGIIKVANRMGRGYSFETIRAKALLAPTMGKMKPCDHCDTATPAKTLREVTASDGWKGDVCGNCHFDFHKMHQQFKATENA
jgi:transposase